jgi:dihydroorotate dehydrogenase
MKYSSLYKSIYISPPFGNYISLEGCKSIRGTYTWHPRKGLIRQVIKTLRPVRGGWKNRIGFRNRGLSTITKLDYTKIYSISRIKEESKVSWQDFLERLPAYIPIEINIGCPNVSSIVISDEEIKNFTKKFFDISIKVSPNTKLSYIEKLWGLGIRKFHLSNTQPIRTYGVSGYPLKRVNLPFLENVAKLNLKYTRLIAGGGIYTPQDVIDYHNAGATDYSLSTIFFTPWKVPKVIKRIKKL